MAMVALPGSAAASPRLAALAKPAACGRRTRSSRAPASSGTGALPWCTQTSSASRPASSRRSAASISACQGESPSDGTITEIVEAAGATLVALISR